MKEIKLTDRAFDDLAEIENYSIDNWGKGVADEYIDGIESGLKLLHESSNLLQSFDEFSEKLKYYRVKKHFLICTETDDFIFVLTIKHIQMDIIELLNKLEPTLVKEVELLVQKMDQ
jgi:toxin ParE1/3/4